MSESEILLRAILKEFFHVPEKIEHFSAFHGDGIIFIEEDEGLISLRETFGMDFEIKCSEYLEESQLKLWLSHHAKRGPGKKEYNLDLIERIKREGFVEIKHGFFLSGTKHVKKQQDRWPKIHDYKEFDFSHYDIWFYDNYDFEPVILSEEGELIINKGRKKR